MYSARIAALAVLAVTSLGWTAPARAAFSGTNGSIAYVEWSKTGERFIESAFLGAEGGLVADMTKLRSTGVDLGGDAFNPGWSANGRNLAFVSTRTGRRQIYSIGFKFSRSLTSFCGVEACPLTSGSGESYEPSWSVDGQSIVFASTIEGIPQIYRMSATGEGVTRLTFDNATDEHPVWSQTGQIAFVSNLTGSPQIYVMNGQGGELRQITQNGVNTDPTWSPNDSELAYESQTPAGFQVFAISSAGGEPRRITSPQPESAIPIWSPDATKLMVIDGPDLSGRSHLEVISAKLGIAVSPRLAVGTGEYGDWAPLPPAPPHHAPPARPGLTAIARPLNGMIKVNPGATQASGQAGEASAPMSGTATQATPASTLKESVEVPVNATYDVAQGTVKLTVGSGVAQGMSTAVMTGGSFLLSQHSVTTIPTIHLVGRPRGCDRDRASIARRRGRPPHVSGRTKGHWKEEGESGSGSSESTRWEVINTCKGTLYRAIEDALIVTDPHRRHPIRVTAGHQYLVRSGRR